MKHSIERLDAWFRRTKGEFAAACSRFAGKPTVYVEIGTWGGGASEWACRNVLTHPDSRGFGVDPYDQAAERRRWDVEEIRATAAARVAATGVRYDWIREPSHTGLLTLRKALAGRPIDLLYVDGLHEAPDVVQDFALAWPMLRDGSVVVFDDFRKGNYAWPHVKEAAAAIELAFRYRVKPLALKRQYSLEVVRRHLPTLKERHVPPGEVHKELAIPHLKRKGGL